jgi:hypothetical protein
MEKKSDRPSKRTKKVTWAAIGAALLGVAVPVASEVLNIRIPGCTE